MHLRHAHYSECCTYNNLRYEISVYENYKIDLYVRYMLAIIYNKIITIKQILKNI